MHLPWYAYLLLGFVLIGWLASKPGFRQWLKILRHKDFSKNPKANPLSEEKLKALSVGLINGEQILSYVDSLTTGLSAERLSTGLEDSWGVADSTSAVEILAWLKAGGHRMAYDAILPLALETKDKEERNRKLTEQYPEEDRLIEFADNLAECIELKKDDPMFPFHPENLQRGIAAWDAGRMVTIARMVYDKGYISESDAWNAIAAAYEMSAAAYSDWKEFAAGYLIGRAMWGGNSMSLDGIFSIAEKSLTSEDSPWKKVSLK